MITKRYFFSAEQAGMETYAKLSWNQKTGWVNVLLVTQDDGGYLYYGTFDDKCEKDDIMHESSALQLIERNETNGYSCGSFVTFMELYESMAKDGIKDKFDFESVLKERQ